MSTDRLRAAVVPPGRRWLVRAGTVAGLLVGAVSGSARSPELRRHDVDLTHGVVKVRRAVVRVGGTFVGGTPKSDATG